MSRLKSPRVITAPLDMIPNKIRYIPLKICGSEVFGKDSRFTTNNNLMDIANLHFNVGP